MILRNLFPVIMFVEHEIIEDEDKLKAPQSASGIHDGEFSGILPTGKKLRLQGLK